MKCDLCGSTNLETLHDIGSDIWDGGEETQHIERCLDCKAYRFICEGIRWKDYYGNDLHATEEFTSYGQWSKDDGFLNGLF